MIDFIEVKIKLSHRPIGSKSFLLLENETITREIRIKEWYQGSYASNVHVRSLDVDNKGFANFLIISGNPAKWFQGHNIFGSRNLFALSVEFIKSIVGLIGLKPTRKEEENIKNGYFELSKVHINTCYEMENEQQALYWIEQVSRYSHSRLASKTFDRGSLYFGRGSRRYTVKFYAKGPEVRKNGLHENVLYEEKLKLHADRLLRAEVELKRQELKRLKLNYAYQWGPETAKGVFESKIRMITIPENVPIPHRVFETLTTTLRDTYLMWLKGLPMRSHPKLKNRQTFKLHRDALLSYGVDIKVPPREPDTDTVIPIWEEISLTEATVPEWALGTPLLFEPKEPGAGDYSISRAAG